MLTQRRRRPECRATVKEAATEVGTGVGVKATGSVTEVETGAEVKAAGSATEVELGVGVMATGMRTAVGTEMVAARAGTRAARTTFPDEAQGTPHRRRGEGSRRGGCEPVCHGVQDARLPTWGRATLQPQRSERTHRAGWVARSQHPMTPPQPLPRYHHPK
mmetsp:Transcript_9597/g.15418  ORF Transcript_9597/g.15418 Transcript_9597/m.15418 type:complete len:161 (+) Transcript_9597:338-820(+)